LPSEESSLFSLQAGNTFYVSLTLRANMLYYESTVRHEAPEKWSIGELPTERWTYLRIDLRPNTGQNYILKVPVFYHK
jgi:hypothetical protein